MSTMMRVAVGGGHLHRFYLDRCQRACPHPQSLIELGSKVNVPLQRGDRLVIETEGGGGYGDPSRRDPAAIEREIEAGLLTRGRY